MSTLVLQKQLARYLALAEWEKKSEYREIVQSLVELKKQRLSVGGGETPQPALPAWLRIVRKTFGFTMTVKLIEGRTDDAEILAIYQRIEEERVDFTGSIVLGMNDGLIELTGVLVGFSSVFNNLQVVALSGTITGISAALSMASSAYMQARHEEGKHPTKAALYTGVAYFVVVMLLVSPYVLLDTISDARLTMFGIIFIILASVSWYTSTLFDRKFGKQFGEIVFFSMGVALVSYGIGTFFRNWTGIEL